MKKLDIQDCKNEVSILLVAATNLMIDAKQYENKVYQEARERYRREAAEYATILLGLKSIY